MDHIKKTEIKLRKSKIYIAVYGLHIVFGNQDKIGHMTPKTQKDPAGTSV